MKSIKKKNCRYNSQITWMLSLWKKNAFWGEKVHFIAHSIFDLWILTFFILFFHSSSYSKKSFVILIPAIFKIHKSSFPNAFTSVAIFSVQKTTATKTSFIYFSFFLFPLCFAVSVYLLFLQRERDGRGRGREREREIRYSSFVRNWEREGSFACVPST